MSFEPKPGMIIDLNGETIEFTPVEASVFVYAETGKEGNVYKILKNQKKYALKVFFPEYQDKRLIKNTEKLSQFKTLRGFRVAERTVINRNSFPEIVDKFPELNYSVLMPWVEGTVWGNLMTSKYPLQSEKYLQIAKLLMEVVYNLETQGLAHCDLSSNNFIIDPMLSTIELIDIEDMFAPDMPRPVPDISYGTLGYRSKWISENGNWGPNSDRFASAILCSEIISWHNKEIRDSKAEDTSFFSEEEIGENSEGYRIMKSCLGRLNGELPVLFEKAWFSKNPDDCPPAVDWMNAVHFLKAQKTVVDGPAIIENENSPDVPRGKKDGITHGVPPKMELSHSMLDFGVLKTSSNDLQIIIENTGGSVLTGNFILAPWLETSPSRFSIQPGDKRKIVVSINSGMPKPQSGLEYRAPNALVIESNAGVEVVGARYKLEKKPFYKTWFTLLILVMLMSGGIWYGVTADDRLYNQAEQSFQGANYNLAIQQLNLLVEKYPSNKALAQKTYLKWGQQLSNAEEYAESNKFLLEGEKLSDSEEAKNSYSELLQQNYLGLAKNEYKKNNLDDGVVYLEKAKALDLENKNSNIGDLYDEFYIGYANIAYSDKKYEEGISYLEKVSSAGITYKNKEVEKLFQKIYSDWIDSLVVANDFAGGAKLLEEAKKYFSVADQSTWSNKKLTLYISWANSLSSSSKFREAIDKINQTKTFNLDSQQKNKAAQASSNILKKFSNSRGEQATTEVKNLVTGMCGPQHSAVFPYPIFSTDLVLKSYVIYNLTSKSIDQSVSPSSIYYVVCVTDAEPVLVEHCSYNQGYSISRYRRAWDIVLYNVLDGKKITSTHLSGASPDGCASIETFTRGEYSVDRYASSNSDSLIMIKWLSQFVK